MRLLLLLLLALNLHGYTWQSRVQVVVDGDLKTDRVYQVTPDARGHLQRVKISEQDSPLPGVLEGIFESDGLVPKMDAYAALAADPGFLARATRNGPYLSCEGALEPGDQVVVTMKGRSPVHMQVRTAWEAAPATLQIDLAPEGYPSQATATVPDHDLQVGVQNTGFRRH